MPKKLKSKRGAFTDTLILVGVVATVGVGLWLALPHGPTCQLCSSNADCPPNQWCYRGCCSQAAGV